jgi:hypothetical protein
MYFLSGSATAIIGSIFLFFPFAKVESEDVAQRVALHKRSAACDRLPP